MIDTPPRPVVTGLFDRMESERRESIGELFAGDAVITVPRVRVQGSTATQERAPRPFVPTARPSSLAGD